MIDVKFEDQYIYNYQKENMGDNYVKVFSNSATLRETAEQDDTTPICLEITDDCSDVYHLGEGSSIFLTIMQTEELANTLLKMVQYLKKVNQHD